MAIIQSVLEHGAGQVVASAVICTAVASFLLWHWREKSRIVPISVNYHFTRKCNKVCKFCFHTEKTSYVAIDADMKKGLKLLKDAGMRKINFAGGEPFLYPQKLAMLCKYCSEVLKLESVSIISNGTLINHDWLERNARYIDVLGVSCDSFDEKTNDAIGRGAGDNVEKLFRVRQWCAALGIKFKLNTVVCALNWQEDMVDRIAELAPFRWKCFQVSIVGDENDASQEETRHDKRKRDARQLYISDQQFQQFCDVHGTSIVLCLSQIL
ncbi:hypothetical protein B0A50_01750 [Salinomyces thailandicus]|uniref:Radical SAM core domain-containing protein n=1 Tax=Salinomyces thailandicus TaxID=706561 RepID=A0A4U0UAF0_9PEZI|nr:hypothetical protein B0A50_01750 [Salinomyces thailandica]